MLSCHNSAGAMDGLVIWHRLLTKTFLTIWKHIITFTLSQKWNKTDTYLPQASHPRLARFNREHSLQTQQAHGAYGFLTNLQ